MWCEQLEKMSQFAETEPHAAYTALTFGLKHRWTYVMRTTPDIRDLLRPLEDLIANRFIPALIGRKVSRRTRNLMALPARLGGMGIVNPTEISDDELNNSVTLTNSLVNDIVMQSSSHSATEKSTRTTLKNISQLRAEKLEARLESILDEIRHESSQSSDEEKMIECCREKGASNWLTTLPIADKGFALNKQEFRDAVRLRYKFNLDGLPDRCSCGENFSVNHAMMCKKGGFVTLRHNEIRDITKEMLNEVCHDVRSEPILTALTGENFRLRSSNVSDEAKVDISARGFWVRGQRAFFDVRVFHPFAPSYRHKSLQATHRQHESEKRRAYNDRILQVEMGSFTPLIFTTTGGMSCGSECHAFYRRLAELLAEHRSLPKSTVTAWLRCRLSFSLLRSALVCIRGTRTPNRVESLSDTSIDVTVATGQLN